MWKETPLGCANCTQWGREDRNVGGGIVGSEDQSMAACTLCQLDVGWELGNRKQVPERCNGKFQIVTTLEAIGTSNVDGLHSPTQNNSWPQLE